MNESAPQGEPIQAHSKSQFKRLSALGANVAAPVAAPSVAAVRERGPWTVAPDAYALWSDDFHHDATLLIRGDFADAGERLEWAEEMCRRLNAALPLPAVVQAAQGDSTL